MKKGYIVVVVCLCLAFAANAAHPSARSQSDAPGGPAFDAASIKLSSSPYRLNLLPGRAWYFPQVGSGRWRDGNITLVQLVEYAYGLHCCNVAVEAGSPELQRWIDKTAFSITATTATKNVPSAQLRAMLRQMLQTRFALKTHATSKVVAVYTLAIAPGGPKLHPVGPCDPGGNIADQPGDIPACGVGGHSTDKPQMYLGSFRSFTMADLAAFWETSMFVVDRHPVVDRTGLHGAYDFDLRLDMTRPQGTDTNPDDYHDLAARAMKALASQDGLKLDVFHTTRMPIQVLVVDHAIIPGD